MVPSLKGKVCLVTGAARGIGRGRCRRGRSRKSRRCRRKSKSSRSRSSKSRSRSRSKSRSGRSSRRVIFQASPYSWEAPGPLCTSPVVPWLTWRSVLQRSRY